MLHISLSGPILSVTETLLGFTSTKVTYWYHNIETWERSVLGRKDETPSQPMSETQIAWVKRHYLPRAFFPEVPKHVAPTYDPKAKKRAEQVTASMEADDFYAGHSREECAVEWRRRYDLHSAQAQRAA